MKYKFNTIIIYYLFYSFNTFGQCESIELRNSEPTLYDLNKASFLTDNMGYVIGDNGTVLKTENGGEDWELKSIAVAWEPLIDIHFFDENNGIVLSNFYVYTTADGGNNWEKDDVTSGTQSSMVFNSNNIGFMSADMKLYMSDSMGKNWGLLKEFTEGVSNLSIVDNNILILTSGSIIYKSEDNGNTWDMVFERESGNYGSVSFWNINSWYSIEKTNSFSDISFIKTNNTGVSFDTVVVAHSPNFFTGNYFISENTGFIMIGDDTGNAPSSILKTTDGGDNWYTVNTVSGTWNRMNKSATFIDENTGYMVGNFGIILKTSDAGENWVNKTDNNTFFFTHTKFINEQIGFVIGEQGVIYRSNDSGDNWNISDSKTTKWFKNINFVDESFVYAVAGSPEQNDDSSDIIISTDSGLTWTVKYNSSVLLRDVHFLDKLRGIAVGSEGTILKTIDGGENWNLIFSGTTKYLSHIEFPTDLVGYIVASGIILKTTDAGDNWNIISDSDLGEAYSAQFIDAEVEYIGSDYGKIYKTTNGGDTFTELDINSNPDIYSLNFLNEQVGYVSTSFDVQKTNDGGQTWSKINFPTSSELRDIEFITENKAIVVGRAGAIFTMETGPPVVNLSISGEMVSCLSGQEYETELVDNITYTWEISDGGTLVPDNNKASVTWNKTGVFKISVTPVNDCGNGDKVEIDIEVNDVPNQDFNISGSQITCIEEQQYSVELIDGVNYRWELPDGGTIISEMDNKATILWGNEGEQNIKVTLFNSCGDGKSQSYLVEVFAVPNKPTISFHSNTLTSSDAESYQWYFNGDLIDGATEQTYKIGQDGIYAVSVSNHCGTSKSDNLDLVFTGTDTISDLNFSVYPNPSANYLSIVVPDDVAVYNTVILDVNGTQVLSDKSMFNNSKIIINLSNITSGVYLLYILTNQGSFTKNIVITR